jgi:shikimate dehydrogenase
MSTAPRAFVIGWPIGHSRSPLIHNYWLRRYGILGSYEAVAVAPEALEGFIREVRAGAYVGGNVTVPHKERVFHLMAGRVDERAAAVEAVNTLYQDADAGLAATNTDIPGFLANLDAAAPGWDRPAGRAVLLGGGGAARGLAWALASRGLVVTVVNRTRARADDIARRIGRGIEAADWSPLPDRLSEADVLVNATSLGMAGNPPLAVDLDPLPRHAIVADIVYVPLETPLLAAARRRGNPVVDGLGMLLHQAVPGFEHWFGVRPEVTDELRALVVADLEGHAR